MSFFVFLYGFCFKVYFVWNEYCNSCFPVFSIRMKFFSSPLLQFICVLCPKVSLLYAACCRILLFSSSLPISYLLIGAFSLLTLKVIIDKCVFTAILNLVFQLILFLFCSLPFVVGWFPFILCLCPLLCSFCECIIWFLFVVALFFKYVNLFLYLLALPW